MGFAAQVWFGCDLGVALIMNPPPFKGLISRNLLIIPVKRRGFINEGSTLNGFVFALVRPRMLGLMVIPQTSCRASGVRVSRLHCKR